jgi:hypothetical protein
MEESQKILMRHIMEKFTAYIAEQGLITAEQRRKLDVLNVKSLEELPQKFVGIAV